MIELLLLLAAVWKGVARARKRGVNPTAYAIAALLGWFALTLIDRAGFSHAPAPVLLAIRWLFVGAVFVVAEFGQRIPKWQCPECHRWNESAALTCACRRVRPDLRPQ